MFMSFNPHYNPLSEVLLTNLHMEKLKFRKVVK